MGPSGTPYALSVKMIPFADIGLLSAKITFRGQFKPLMHLTGKDLTHLSEGCLKSNVSNMTLF